MARRAVAVGRFAAVAVAVIAATVPVAAHAEPEPPECAPSGPVVAPIGTTSCPGVHPGAEVTSTLGPCTLNFIFTGTGGERYIGTAGHCIVDEGTPSASLPAPGPVAFVDGQRVGEFVYAVHEQSHDFALIRLDDGIAAWPALPHFGGPTGIYTDRSLTPVVLHHVGNGVVAGEVTKARSMVAPNTFASRSVAAMGLGLWGDSGSPVISSDGRAVGVLIHLTEVAIPSVGTSGISRLDYQLPFAEAALDTTLTLATAPLRPRTL